MAADLVVQCVKKDDTFAHYTLIRSLMLKTFVTCRIPGEVFGNGICYFSALLSANFFGIEFSKIDTYGSAKIQHKILAKN